jgi:hypothetical protein
MAIRITDREVDESEYSEEMLCEKCHVVIGYAPYYRTEYLCVECKDGQEKDN